MWTFQRRAARAVVVDGGGRVLLLRASDPAHPAKGEWWELPGGGVEEGETTAHAAAREVHEETGLRGVEMGPCLWTHRARFTFAGMRFDQQEYIHVARWSGVAVSEYRPGGLESLEAMAFKGMDWWTDQDLAAMAADGGKVIPPWLPAELPRYLADPGALSEPAEPADMGELGDVF